MPYPERLIREGETVALDLRPHWWYFSRSILTGIPLFVILGFILNGGDDVRTYAGPVVGVTAIVWGAWLLLKYLQWTMTYFVVTNSRVIYRTGVLSKRGVEIPLDRVNNINFSQTVWDRVIGAGNLDIESAGKDGQSHFDFVRHPDGVQHEIYTQMDGYERGRTAPVVPATGGPVDATSGPSGPTVPEQIEQLARLRDAGRITVEEYEAKKTELLDRM